MLLHSDGPIPTRLDVPVPSTAARRFRVARGVRRSKLTGMANVWTEASVEFGGVEHYVRYTPGHVRGFECLQVQYWGRDAWVPAGGVLGRDDDAEDRAVALGVRKSADARVAWEAGR